MNIRILKILTLVLPAFMMICTCQKIFSQEPGTSKVVHPGWFIGISAGPTQTRLINEGILSVSQLISNQQTSFAGTVEIGYFFSRHFGLSSGIGFTSYKTQLTLINYQNKFNSVDTENEAYERQVLGINIKEIQHPGFLSIPLLLNTRMPLGKMVGFYLQAGVSMSFPISKGYTSSGLFTFKGYYPAYNLTLENLPAYGFPTSYYSSVNGNLELNSLIFSTIASAGFDFTIQKKVQIGIAATYNKSLSGISAYTEPEKFQLSSDINQISSLMGGSSKTPFQSIGLNLTVRYYLKPKF